MTPETIKVGFLIAQVGGLDAAGFALGLRGDIEQVIKAYVDDINARGGIHGRRVVYVTQKVDPLSQSNQRAACLRVTEDEKVFAVLDSATTLGAAELCYGKEHKTPYFNTGISTVSSSYGQQLRRVGAELACTIVLIEHDMGRHGAGRPDLRARGRPVIAEGGPDEVRADPRVIASYLGSTDATIQRSRQPVR